MQQEKAKRVYRPKPCAECNKEFTPRAAQSRVCDECNTVKCNWCGISFLRPPSIRKFKTLFCSMACKKAHERRDTVTMQCEHCGKEILRAKWEQDRRFCSRHCQHIWMVSNPDTYNTYQKICCKCGDPFLGRENRLYCDQCELIGCAQCGNKFRKQGGQIAQALRSSKTGLLFCGKACLAQAKREKRLPGRPITRKPRPCRWCGKEFKPRHNYNPQYCSNECRIEATRNGARKRWTFSRYYGPNWKDQRGKALERDKVCQRCRMDPLETGVRLHVHHIKPFRLFGVERYKKANALSNLVSLCPNCHRITESEEPLGPIQPNVFTGKVAW